MVLIPNLICNRQQIKTRNKRAHHIWGVPGSSKSVWQKMLTPPTERHRLCSACLCL
uniref:Uncharacterized protein n=1 Tax=Anguilla anguilla TaxID=7936 RepID=A0A0E9QHQ6_ANGAN